MAVEEVSRIQTDRDKCRADALTNLRWAIDQIENNDGIAVMGIVEDSKGGYRQFGSITMSRLQTAGALLELAMYRLER
jgi:hypothetical protein